MVTSMLLWNPFSPGKAATLKLAHQLLLNPLTQALALRCPFYKSRATPPLTVSRVLPATSAKSAVVSMTGVGGAEVWQWFIPTPSEKWEEETGSGEGERWRLFQHLYPDTDPLLRAVLPQGTWCRKTSQLGWVAFLARALWQQSEECYLWHGLYITIFVCVRLNIYIYV